MRYKLLGRSGLRVSEIALGAMTFGEDWGWGASKDECRQIFEAYVEAGGNFIDTANHYTNGTSERIVGELIQERRSQMVVATKYTLNPRPADPNGGGNHRKNLVQSLEASLKRLNTDYIDLYWVHAWDGMTPTEEIMRALDDAVRAGKVLYVGISDAPAWEISRANTMAEFRGWSPFVGLQIPYSLIERTPERDLLPMAKSLDIGVTTWGPVGGGALTGKYRKGEPGPKGDRLTGSDWGAATLTDRTFEIGDTVRDIAAETDHSPAQIAIAWVLSKRRLANIIPIIGARRLAQLKDNLGALRMSLDEHMIARLDAVSAVPLGFPHDFLIRSRPFVFGETFERIDNHRG